MFIMNGNDIEITKGDCGIFTVSFTGDDAPVDGTHVLVSLKKSVNEDEAIWEKDLTVSSGIITVSLENEDTNLDFGGYSWDLRIIYNDGFIYTPIDPASFVVKKVVGNVEQS